LTQSPCRESNLAISMRAFVFLRLTVDEWVGYFLASKRTTPMLKSAGKKPNLKSRKTKRQIAKMGNIVFL
jgi:hypothetical protein